MASIMEVIRATDIDGAPPLLADPRRDSLILAGGTDLLLKYQSQGGPAVTIVEITGIPSLSQVDAEETGCESVVRSVDRHHKVRNRCTNAKEVRGWTTCLRSAARCRA